MIASDTTDQPLYAVSGAIITVHNLDTTRIEEGVVASNDSIVTINDWNHYGSGGWLIGVQDCQRMNIGALAIHPDRLTGAQFEGGIIRTRNDNVAAGAVYIGEVSGIGRLRQLMKMDVGTVNFMQFGNFKFTHLYNTAVSASTTQFGSTVALKAFTFTDWWIKVKDENDVLAGENFEFRLPVTNLAGKSLLRDFEFELLDSTGSTTPNATVRIISPKQELIDSRDLRMQTNVGPYGRDVKYAPKQSITNIPTTQYWGAGEYLLRGKSAAPFKAYCYSAGTPGSWAQA